jgi:hypothetical protein
VTHTARGLAFTATGAGVDGMPVPASHHGHDLERWPLRDWITFGALAGAVPSARAHLRQLLWEWRQAELGQDASIVLSELVTNSVAASATATRTQ